MSPSQIQNIRETREKQLEEKQTQQQMRETMDKQWDDERIRQAKVSFFLFKYRIKTSLDADLDGAKRSETTPGAAEELGRRK